MADVFRETFRKGSRTFFYSSVLFPKSFARDVAILYSFVRVADDFVDVVPADKVGFNSFVKSYRRARTLKSPLGHIIIDSFVDLAKRKGFVDAHVDAFFRSMRMDLVGKKCVTKSLQDDYLFGSAEVVGVFMNRIFCVPKRLDKDALLLGRSFQLINWLRDVAEDEVLGRQYFTNQQLSSFGLSSLSREEAQANPVAFNRFMRHHLDVFFKDVLRLRPAIRMLPRSARPAVLTAVRMFSWTAKKIYSDPFIVFERKVKPAKWLILFYASYYKVMG